MTVSTTRHTVGLVLFVCVSCAGLWLLRTRLDPQPRSFRTNIQSISLHEGTLQVVEAAYRSLRPKRSLRQFQWPSLLPLSQSRPRHTHLRTPVVHGDRWLYAADGRVFDHTDPELDIPARRLMRAQDGTGDLLAVHRGVATWRLTRETNRPIETPAQPTRDPEFSALGWWRGEPLSASVEGDTTRLRIGAREVHLPVTDAESRHSPRLGWRQYLEFVEPPSAFADRAVLPIGTSRGALFFVDLERGVVQSIFQTDTERPIALPTPTGWLALGEGILGNHHLFEVGLDGRPRDAFAFACDDRDTSFPDTYITDGILWSTSICRGGGVRLADRTPFMLTEPVWWHSAHQAIPGMLASWRNP